MYSKEQLWKIIYDLKENTYVAMHAMMLGLGIPETEVDRLLDEVKKSEVDNRKK
jgi:hypothetical protein